MDFFNEIFAPVILPIPELDEYLKIEKQKILKSKRFSPKIALEESFVAAWHYCDLPDEMTAPLHRFWPSDTGAPQMYDLWSFLVDDLIISSLIYFRHKFVTEESQYSLSDLCNNYMYPPMDLSNGSHRIREAIPPIICDIFHIPQFPSDKGYKIQTPYPALVAAIIQHSASIFPKGEQEKWSFKKNLSFFNACTSNFAGTNGNRSKHALEELYMLERVFNVMPRLATQLRMIEELEGISEVACLMPNIMTRIDLINAIASVKKFRDDPTVACNILKFIGGIFFPIWQWLFCSCIEEYVMKAGLIRILEVEALTQDSKSASASFMSTAEPILSMFDIKKKRQDRLPLVHAINWWGGAEQISCQLAQVNNRSVEQKGLLMRAPLFDPKLAYYYCCDPSKGSVKFYPSISISAGVRLDRKF